MPSSCAARRISEVGLRAKILNALASLNDLGIFARLCLNLRPELVQFDERGHVVATGLLQIAFCLVDRGQGVLDLLGHAAPSLRRAATR